MHEGIEVYRESALVAAVTFVLYYALFGVTS